MLRLLLTYFLLTTAATAFTQTKSPSAEQLRLRLADSRSDTARINVLSALGRHYLDKAGTKKTDLDTALSFFNQAMLLSRQTHYALTEIIASRDIANVHLHQEKPDLAERELKEVLAQCKVIGYKFLDSTYDLLAEVSRVKTDMKKEFYYRMEAVKSMEETADTLAADTYYARLALIYSDLDMHKESELWIKKSINILLRRKKTEDLYGDLSLLIYDLVTEDRPAEALQYLQNITRAVPPIDLSQKVDIQEEFAHCYRALKQYGKAEQYYLEMMRLYKITNFNANFYATNDAMVTDYIYYNQTLSDFYILTKQYQKAGYYLNKILALPEGAVRSVSLSKIHESQFLVDSASGNYISAIRHFEAHKKIADSLFNVAQSKQISEMSIKYQSEKKQQDLDALRSKAQLQEQELERSAQARRFTYALVGVLVVLIGVGYSRYRLKQKSNRLLQAQQKEINAQYQVLVELNAIQEKLLSEKEWLVKEIHHRVKNNLQIVISLLNAQSEFLDHPSALHAIRESRERMQAIALIHQKLYQPDQDMTINMDSYIREMVSYLGSGFANTERIYFQLDVDEIDLDVSQAVPLGLILNEAITNAVKYAFPKDGRGTITISLKRVNETDILLEIADNGQGLPSHLNLLESNSLGIQLIRLFSEQLEGDIRFRNSNGLEITLIFKQHLTGEHVAPVLFSRASHEQNINS